MKTVKCFLFVKNICLYPSLVFEAGVECCLGSLRMYHVTIFAQHKKFGIHATGTDVRLKNVTVTHLHYKLPRAAIESSQSRLSLHRCHFRCCKGILMKTSHALLHDCHFATRSYAADMSRDMSRECRVVVVGKTNFFTKKEHVFLVNELSDVALIGPDCATQILSLIHI